MSLSPAMVAALRLAVEYTDRGEPCWRWEHRRSFRALRRRGLVTLTVAHHQRYSEVYGGYKFWHEIGATATPAGRDALSREAA